MIDRREFLWLSGLGGMSFDLSGTQRAKPRSEFDYVDWSWENWLTITGEKRPQIVTEQTGKAELTNLLEAGGRPISTTGAWESNVSRLRAVLDMFLGRPPDKKPDLQARTLEEIDCGSYVRRRIEFQSEPGEFVPSYLLVPKDAVGARPVVVCPHQTTQEGKREPAGLAGNPNLHMAVHLVNRGYVTLTYDALCFGERHNPASGHYGDAIPFYRRRPEWSLLGKMVWDLERALDYLLTLDFVDPTRVGCIGHSHGGITTLFAMASDPRITAGVSNCGLDCFRIDGNVWRWSRATALVPRLGFYIGSRYLTMDFYRAVPDSEVIQVPFDMHQVLALVAPRPLMLTTSDRDFVFPNGGWSARQCLARLEPVYALYRKTEHLGSFFFKAGHSFPPDVSDHAYAWLDRWLRTGRRT
ncbi:MAG: alpha/beta hydrolase family protein [Acidobacteriota bacterium]